MATNIELGVPKSVLDANQAANMYINSIQNSWNRARPSPNDFVKPTISLNCGYYWSTSYRQNCPAHGKNCKKCGIANRFAKVCRKTKPQMKPKPRIDNVDDTTSEAATIGTSATVGEQVNQIEKVFQGHILFDANYDSDYDELDDKYVAVISDNDNIREVEPVNVNIRI